MKLALVIVALCMCMQCCAAQIEVLYFDMDSAVISQALSYEEQLLCFVFEGLVNQVSLDQPRLMFNAGYLNFDWPGADGFWANYLTEEKRVIFKNFTDNTVCGLVAEGDPTKLIQGIVLYDDTLSQGAATEWILPIAMTIASQNALLPATITMLERFPCLAQLPVVKDLRSEPWAADSALAWDWAFKNLLPQASKTVAFNLYHYHPEIRTDPQSNATLANVDFAIQQRAFIMNFRTTGNPTTYVNPLFSQALANMDPLFSLYGWADDEFGLVWMTSKSGAGPDGTANASAAGGGGAVFCSFATPNLSFWKLLPIPGRTTARPLPVFDRGMALDPSKYYVLLETNEGDTPRIVVSAFSKSWTDPRRGSLPVSWAIDPVLGEQFPALFDFFSSSASVNDSFISGPGGCGYVYYGNMSDAQIQAFATRCGRLMKTYGPAIVDTFGQTGDLHNTEQALATFSQSAAASGVAPSLYISQPTSNIKYSYFNCQSSLNQRLADGTPLLCTNGALFYIPPGGLNCTSCEIAARINKVAQANKPPFFITVYGGLHWTSGAVQPDLEFWNLWGSIIAKLESNIVPVGAQEMARLAREAAMRDMLHS